MERSGTETETEKVMLDAVKEILADGNIFSSADCLRMARNRAGDSGLNLYQMTVWYLETKHP
eukprot:CAMPEP_0182494356 /NCGR_PEP_ID=MMETSP1321-20130603/3232_1 /TAXON_ID=91990 /ORGANISM="Bolidomonas sp., Strain RCC1657" /LENGTH=61 /DNA_ID=CAMNT_0024697407 /DNA_START=55 /DNA_END=237 /DNA_ORIENTATION=+